MRKQIYILVLAILMSLPGLAKNQRQLTTAQTGQMQAIENAKAKDSQKQDKTVENTELRESQKRDRTVEKTEAKENQKRDRIMEKAEMKEEAASLKTQVVEATTSQNTWLKGSNTVVQLKGQASEDSALCKTFQVKLAVRLEFKIECIGQEVSDSIILESNSSRTVAQKGEHLTVTQYGYITKKPRIGKAKNSTLKVPFVERIIHIKKMPDGEMAFYLESFREDEFGRIVQDGFIQAHSLVNTKMKISAN